MTGYTLRFDIPCITKNGFECVKIMVELILPEKFGYMSQEFYSTFAGYIKKHLYITDSDVGTTIQLTMTENECRSVLLGEL